MRLPPHLNARRSGQSGSQKEQTDISTRPPPNPFVLFAILLAAAAAIQPPACAGS